MLRQLYRIYLYVVSIALLVFAAVGLYSLLDTLLAFTPLRGSYRSIPSGSTLTQQVVFALVAWLIAGLLGWLHYHLIRRDIASDPAGGSGAVRAFFLNLAQAVAAVIVVSAGIGAFSALAYAAAYAAPGTTADTSGAFAGMLTALAVAALLQWERSRTRAAPGLATTFQRLHLYGVPLGFLLFAVAGTWDSAMKTTLDHLLIWANVYNPVDPRACGPSPVSPVPTPIEGVCSLPNVWYLWLATLVAVAAIAIYALLTRGDTASVLRAVAHLASFGVGVAFALVGLDRAVELALRGLFAIPVSWSEVAHPWNAPYNFVSPATFGLVALLVYGLWLRREASELPLGRANTGPARDAVAAVFMAVPFYWGLGRALYTAFEWWAGARNFAYPAEWAAALALMVTGVGYIALDVHLRARQATEAGASAPRRAFVLALLAGGIVTGAVGLAVALYALGTALLGAPLLNWEQTARAGAAALVVGAVLVGIYGWIALRGRYVAPLMSGLGALAQAAPHGAPESGNAESGKLVAAIEGILDDYASQRIARDQAAERILELTQRR